MLHAPIMVKAMYALLKPFLKQHIKNVIHMGGTVEAVQERLPKTLLPKAWGGTQGNWDMNDKLVKALKMRYEHKAAFRL